MSKAFTKDTDTEPDEPEETDALPVGQKNYMTPHGHAVLKEELRKLMLEDRPKVVEVVSWAAGNGDRSENGDYIYGKRRLREIDRRVRYLTKRLDNAAVVDPKQQTNTRQVFFGATVKYERDGGEKHTVQLVGIDEAELSHGKISWLSPMAKALMRTKVGDVVELRAPAGPYAIEVLSIRYDA